MMENWNATCAEQCGWFQLTARQPDRWWLVREDMMRRRWMPWRWVPTKDVATLRKGRGSREQAVSPTSPNGATPLLEQKRPQ